MSRRWQLFTGGLLVTACLAGIVALLLGLARWKEIEEEPAPIDAATRSEALSRSKEIVARANRWFREHGYAEVQPPGENARVESRFHYQMQRVEIIDVEEKKDDVRIELLRKTRGLVTLINDKAFDQFSGGGAPLYDKPTAPLWTPEEAIKQGVDFATALLGKFPENLGPGNARYDHSRIQMRKYYRGMWMIEWKRVDKQGYKFIENDLVVELSETAGPLLASIKLDSAYTEGTFKPIAETEAARRAFPVAESMAFSGVLDRFFRNLRVEPTPKAAALWIVIPNIQRMRGGKDSGPARLAWVMQYEARSAKKPSPGSAYEYWVFEVWIDAETGDLLGGGSY